MAPMSINVYGVKFNPRTSGDDRRRADPRAERRADADHRKQPPALAFRVEVVGEGPELRDDEDIEDAEPDVERHALAHAGSAQHEEATSVGRKKQAASW